MLSILWSELEGQPEALRRLARNYLEGEGRSLLASIKAASGLTFTGMGASYHAAWVCALHLNSLGVPARHVEAADLLNYANPSLGKESTLVYFSQCGCSAEVEPILQILRGEPLIAITNELESPLARRADISLPMHAGQEEWIASKTYLNALALGWLLVYRLAGRPDPNAIQQLQQIADRCQAILERAGEAAGDWLELFSDTQTLVFTGHGPHAATARQAAMLVGEWAKRPAISASIGGFRHGFIEMAGPGSGAVVFAPPGRSQASALSLAGELSGYGLLVQVVANGITAKPGEKVSAESTIDEFLSPILDILPVQAFVDRLALDTGIAPGFQRIQKIVTQM